MFPLSWSCTERQFIIKEAIAEAAAYAAVQNNNDKIFSVVDNIENSRLSSASLLKHFKKAPEETMQIGAAQLLYQDIVDRAVKKMEKMEIEALGGGESAKASVAQMHKSDSLITQEELAEMWSASGCRQIRSAPACDRSAVFRTIDGTCNNQKQPLFGSAGINLRRLLRPVYENKRTGSLRGSNQFKRRPFSPPVPSARTVSAQVVRNVVKNEGFSHFVMQWGQFLDHDMGLSPEVEIEGEECEEGRCHRTRACQPIRVNRRDPDFGRRTDNKGRCIPFTRSLPGCSLRSPRRVSCPREQINAITSFIDASMVYGSSRDLNMALREGRGGLLKVGPGRQGQKELLPFTTPANHEMFCHKEVKPCFLCGDGRCNEQTALTIMHTIWLREHNRCARALSRLNMMDNDERVFQDCRKIVGALIQKITYSDYLPKIFGSQMGKFVGSYTGYKPNVNPQIPNSFSTAAYRYGHSLVRPRFSRLGSNYEPLPMGPLKLVDAFFNTNKFFSSGGTDPIVRGLLATKSLRADEFINKVLTTQLFKTESSPGLDLAALNIQRGRDHGLPPYNRFKRFCQRTFGVSSRFENRRTAITFRQLYGRKCAIDLFVGGLAERRLSNSVLGATFSCIFGLSFRNLRNGDRFYYENPGVFTSMQLSAIKKRTLSHVLCDNLDNLVSVQSDAFLVNDRGSNKRVSCKSFPKFNYMAWRRGGDEATNEQMEKEEAIDYSNAELMDEEGNDYDDVDEEAFDDEDEEYFNVDEEAFDDEDEEFFNVDEENFDDEDEEFDEEVDEEEFDAPEGVEGEFYPADMENDSEAVGAEMDASSEMDVSSKGYMALKEEQDDIKKMMESLEDSLTKAEGHRN